MDSSVDNKRHSEDILVTDFDMTRTLFHNKDDHAITTEEFYKNVVGLIIFIVVFVIMIPHFLLKKEWYLFSTLYFSNLDLTATVLGFSGGPYEIWKFLYNPAATTMFGFFSSSLINYLALIGVGFVCIQYATINKRIFGGLSLLLVILPITYLFPGNFIVYLMNSLAKYLYQNNFAYYARWLITVITGLFSVTGIIGLERIITENLAPSLEKLMLRLYKYYKK